MAERKYSQAITNSRAKEFRRCARRHYYLYELGIHTDEKSVPLIFGTEAHRLIEDELWGRELDYDTHELVETMGDEGYKLMPLVTGYGVYWKKLNREYEVIATELEFDLPFKNPLTGGVSRTYRLRGKIDAIVKHGGEFLLMEHKTASPTTDIREGSRYWQRLFLDEQVSVYIYACQQLGYAVNTCVYDVLRKPPNRKKATPVASRKYKKDGNLYKNQRAEDEGIEEWQARMIQAIGADPSSYYARGTVTRLDDEITAFMTALWWEAKMMTEYRKANVFPCNSNSCFDYGRQCEFFDLCTGQSSIEEPRWLKKERIHAELTAEKETKNEPKKPQTLQYV